MALPAAGEKNHGFEPHIGKILLLFFVSARPRVRAPYRELGNLNSSSLLSVRLVLPDGEPEIGSLRLPLALDRRLLPLPRRLAPHASQELQRSSLAPSSPCVFFGLRLGAGRLEPTCQVEPTSGSSRMRAGGRAVSRSLFLPSPESHMSSP